MKLHDNSAFGRVAVVPGTSSNFLKKHSLIEFPSHLIGFPDLQKSGPSPGSQQVSNEGFSSATPAEIRMHRQIQNFTFPGGDIPRHDKTNNPVVVDSYAEIVDEVVAHRPLGALRDEG